MTEDEVITRLILENKVKENEELKTEIERLQKELEWTREKLCDVQLRIRKLSKLITDGNAEAGDEHG